MDGEPNVPLPYEFGPDLEPVLKDAALVDQAFHATGPGTRHRVPIPVKSLKRKYVEGLIDIEEFEEWLPACIEYSDRYRPEREPGMTTTTGIHPVYTLSIWMAIVGCVILICGFMLRAFGA